MIDLHVHTNASADAQHTPAEIFEMSRQIGLRCIAFADHNTIEAVPDGLRLQKQTGIEFITGVELNTELAGEDIHLLGYGFNPDDARLKNWFKQIERRFWAVAEQRVQRFAELGLGLSLAEVKLEAKGKLPTGSSFLDAMSRHEENLDHPLVKPYVQGEKASNPYVSFYFEVMSGGGPGDVGEVNLPVEETIAHLRDLGAAPVVAHPRNLPEEFLRKMIAAGLMGVEAFCSYHDSNTANRWREQAEKYHLLYTAGSDFHGVMFKPKVKLGETQSNDYSLAERLKEAIHSLS